MKSIIKLFLMLVFVPLLFVACDNDEVEQIETAKDIRLADPGINSVNLNIAQPDQDAFLISWDDFSGKDAKYTVQLSNDKSFENSTDLGETTKSFFTYKSGALNQVLSNYGFVPYTALPVYLRVTNGSNVSNVISFNVLTYPTEKPVLNSTEGLDLVLLADTPEEVAHTFSWKDYEYSTGADVAYKLQFAQKDDFSTVKEFNVNGNQKTFTHKELNNVALDLGLKAEEKAKLNVRVVADVKAPTNEELSFVSDATSFMVTPFDAGNKLYLVGSVQENYGLGSWSPTEAIELRYIGDDTTQLFEGYLKIKEGDQFKFIDQQADWNDLESIYGTENDEQNGSLYNSENSSNIKVEESGFYYVRVDLDNLTYQLVKMNWGIIGTATPNGWDGETAMIYNFDSNQYEWSGNLNDGIMKFRAQNVGQAIYNNDWSFNMGNDTVAWDIGSSNIEISGGEYNITVSFDPQGNATINGLN